MEYAVKCVVGIELKEPRQAKGADGRHGIERHVEDTMGSWSIAGSPSRRSMWT